MRQTVWHSQTSISISCKPASAFQISDSPQILCHCFSGLEAHF
ncbi:hypothetical protein DCAR_0207957 [Daucus carota subsp. sativus]|uniref:Uncharacterized protein n=1 Tax=Daucus carota subsp. sativus TaxID=79200 RepID=A0AAF0WFR9_DAUCS|nr:hypothetical protein DCAR_0207957 [Daucus carota subsp. sativus]